MRALTSLILLLPLAACGPKVDPNTPFDIDDDRPGVPATAVAPLPVEAPPGSGSRTMTMDRATLAASLAVGPPAFLRQVEVTADTIGDRFLGWRLVQLLADASPSLRSLDVLPGDVLLDVNGAPVAKPDDLMNLWTSLSGAPQIVFNLTRGGAPFAITVAVTDAPAS